MERKYDEDLRKGSPTGEDAFPKEVGSLLSTAKGDAYRRENPEDFLSDGSLVNPSFMEVTVVARAVDDGMIYASESSWENESKASNVHKITDAIRRTRENVSHRIHGLSDSVKSNASQVSRDVKSKAIVVGDGIKREVTAVDKKVKANPYLFALGAVGVGFVLGRFFLSTRKAKMEVPQFQDYQGGMKNEHTGIHVRDRSRFA